MAERYQAPSSFVTLSFADLSNPRSIRGTFRTVNNRTFPAVFNEGSEHGSNGEEFMQHLLKSSTIAADGNIQFRKPIGHSYSERARAGIDDPITFVSESKTMINDVCCLLFGVPLENFYAKTDGISRRKTKYYRCFKGIGGHVLKIIAKERYTITFLFTAVSHHTCFNDSLVSQQFVMPFPTLLIPCINLPFRLNFTFRTNSANN